MDTFLQASISESKPSGRDFTNRVGCFGRIHLTSVNPLSDFRMLNLKSTPSQAKDLSRTHTSENRQLHNQPLPLLQQREHLLHRNGDAQSP
jgi:hypothetical protein